MSWLMKRFSHFKTHRYWWFHPIFMDSHRFVTRINEIRKQRFMLSWNEWTVSFFDYMVIWWSTAMVICIRSRVIMSVPITARDTVHNHNLPHSSILSAANRGETNVNDNIVDLTRSRIKLDGTVNGIDKMSDSSYRSCFSNQCEGLQTSRFRSIGSIRRQNHLCRCAVAFITCYVVYLR